MTRFSLVLAAAMLLGTATRGGVVQFTDFSSTAGLTLNGSATTTTTADGSVLRLTPAAYNQSGSAFSSTTINAATFSTEFKFRLTNPGGIFDGIATGADGFVFVIQPVSSSIGGAGGGMGYQGISPSVGVEYDTWLNGWDPDSNHLGVDTNGNMTSLSTVHVTPDFDDGNLWYTWIDYNGTTLEVRAAQTGVRPASALLSYDIDVAGIIGTTTAYVGFTAGTGSAYENQDIIGWEYRDSFNPIGGGDTVPEPATLLLLAMGGLGLAIARRRHA
jgi:hypothetical protein